MNASTPLVLPVSGGTVEFIPYVTGAILLDISKQTDINKYLIATMVTKITAKPEKEGEPGLVAPNNYEEIRKMHGRDFKALDKKLQEMLEEAKDPTEEETKKP